MLSAFCRRPLQLVRLLAVIALVWFQGGVLQAATLTWEGGGADSLLSTGLNWTSDQAPTSGDSLVFAGGVSLSPELETNLTVGTITFNAAAQSFTLGGIGIFTVNSGITNNSAATQTLDTAIRLGGGQTWNASSGDLVFGGGVESSGYTLTISGNKNTTILGVIAGSGALSKTGAGTLQLLGANTFSGGTTLRTGRLIVGSNTAVGTGVLTLSGGIIQAANGERVLANPVSLTSTVTFSGADNLVFNGAVTLGNKGSINVAGPGTVTFNGTVGPNQNKKLTKNGAGTLVLNGSNTYRGTTSLKQGTLVIGSNTAVGSGSLSLGTATIEAGGAARTLANNVALAGNTTFGGIYDLTLTGNASLSASRVLTVTSANTTFRGTVSGASFAITKAGAGTLTLNGTTANSFSGGLTIADGTVIFGKTSGVNALAGNVMIGDGAGTVGSALLLLNAANQIPNTSTLTVRADGIFNLGASSEGIGSLSMSGGSIIGTSTSRLDLGGDASVTPSGSDTALIAANLGLNGNRILQLANNSSSSDADLAITGVISNGSAPSRITKTGDGALLMSGANSFTGGAIILGGTVLLDAPGSSGVTNGSLGTGPIILGDTGGTLSATLLFTAVPGRALSNPINVRAGSGGPLTLGGLNSSGINTFSGDIALDATVELAAATGGEIALTGALNGAGGVTKNGAGTVRFGAANNYGGATTINAGTLALGVSNALGSGAVTVNGGLLDMGFGHADSVAAVKLAGGAISGSGSTLTSTSGFTVQSGTIGVVLAGNVGLTKSGPGMVNLNAPATYAGATTIDGGTLRLGVVQALPAATALTVASGATLDLNGYDQSSASLSGGGTITLGSARLTINATGSSIFGGAIGGTGGLTKAGTGILTMAGASSFAGELRINAGTLRLGAVTALPATVPVNVASSGIFDVAGFNARVGSISGGGSVVLGGGTLTSGGDNTSTLFSGVISGSGSFVKSGTGVLNFSAESSFTGNLTIDRGSLVLSGPAGRISNAASIMLSPASVLTLDNSGNSNADRLSDSALVRFSGGELRLLANTAGSSETLGTLALAGGASRLTVFHSGGAGISSSITFGGLGTVAAGATIDFNSIGGILGATADGPHVFIAGHPNGIMASWARVGSDFAQYTGYGVSAFTGYYTGFDGINVNDPIAVVRLTGTSPLSAWTLTRAGTTTDAGLNLTDLSTVDLGSSAGNTLNLANGGLIKSAAPPTAIVGAGRLTAGNTAAAQLNVAVQGGQSLTIAAPIINNAGPNGIYGDSDDGVVALVANDEGTLVLAGSNAYSGGNFLNSGTVSVSADANLGTGINDVTFAGGTLQITASFQPNVARRFVVRPSLTGEIQIGLGQTLTIAGADDLVATGDASSRWFKSGEGSLILGNANPNFTGVLQIDAGTVELRDASAVGAGLSKGAVAMNGGALRLTAASDVSFGNDLTVLRDSSLGAARLGAGVTPATVSLGQLTIGSSRLALSATDGMTSSVASVSLAGTPEFAVQSGTTVLGSISGPFGIRKSGGGILDLRGVGSYLGTTTIDAGLLRLGAANAIPATSAVLISAGSTLDTSTVAAATVGSISGAGDLIIGTKSLSVGGDDASSAFVGAISGSGSLIKAGNGTFTLGGLSPFTGLVSVEEGKVAFTIANALASSAALQLGANTAVDLNGYNQTFRSVAGSGVIALGGGTLTSAGTTGTSTYSGIITGTGGVTKSGSSTWVLQGANTFSGPATVSTGTLALESSQALGSSSGGTNVASGAELLLGSGLAIIGEPLSIEGAGLLGGGALRLSSGASSWSGKFSLTGAAAIGADSGTLSLGGSIALAADTLTFTGAGNIDAAFAISGSGSLLKRGTGTLSLSGANSFSGGLRVEAGIVRVRNPSALGISGSSGPAVVLPGASLQFDDPSGIDLNSTSVYLAGVGQGLGAILAIVGDTGMEGAIVLTDDSAIGVGGGASLTIAGAISEMASGLNLTKLGSGTLFLAGANSFSGTLSVQAGTVQIASDQRIAGLASLHVQSGGVFDLNDSSESVNGLTGSGEVRLGTDSTALFMVGVGGTSSVFSGNITGFGDLEKVGAGVLRLAGTNTFTGDLTISEGVLAVQSDASLGFGILRLDGGTLRALADLTLDRNLEIGPGNGAIDSNGNTVVLTGSIEGTGTLSKAGDGTARLSGSSPTFVGTLEAQAGLLEITGVLGLAKVTVEGGATLGGVGTVGPVTVLGGGRVTPGEPLGRLSTGSLTLLSGAQLVFELGGTNAGVNYDQIKAAGTVSLNGYFTLALANGFQPAIGNSFNVILNDATDPIISTFAGLPEGAEFPMAGLTFSISYHANGDGGSFGNDVSVTVRSLSIPEPGTATMFLMSACVFAAYQRFRRRIPPWPLKGSGR